MKLQAITAFITLVTLTGCGLQPYSSSASTRVGMVRSQSLAGATKGVRAMYLAAFKSADKDENGYLTIQEMMPALPNPPQFAPNETLKAAKALFDSLDLNKDGKIRFREFTAPPVMKAAVTVFRHEVGKTFAALDLNGDRLLEASELAKSPVVLASGDKNQNGSLTLSEFEDAFAATLGQGAEPVDPPANEPPASGDDDPPSDDPDAPDTP
ncbi:MAG: EF-hand domain-containing protein [Candidatus Sericytochromatia bacterium]|nr:EF-hand domain-containing protein [Candidatus Sericytochromatia bacterium]